MKRLVLLLTVVLLLHAGCATSDPTRQECRSITLGEETVSPDVLVERVGVAEAEAKNMTDGVPFGPRNAGWQALKNDIEPGDELWFYRDNRAIAGAEGYVLVRDCEAIAFVMTVKY